MAYNAIGGFPAQQLPFSKKTKSWRKNCIDFGDNHSLLHYHLARKSVFQMRINYDLLNGKLHVDDMKELLNPYHLDASFIPDNIQHYPILNSKLNVLRGEETERLFDYRVVVTNPSGISDIEEAKNAEINQRLQSLLSEGDEEDAAFQKKLERLSDYFQYDWQDKREQRANMLLNHYVKELDLNQLFNLGLIDAEAVGEEIYQVDIVGGEPAVFKLDPMKVRILKSGYTNRIEDADMIVIEDYWSPGRIIDTFWDNEDLVKRIKELENAPESEGYDNPYTDSMGNIDERYGFVPTVDVSWAAGDEPLDANILFDNQYDTTMLPYDMNGNIRVLRVYWKSRRKIKKVKSYDLETGEEQYNFYPENYRIKPELGEEEQVFWINEAWEGTKIGKDIYVNMRPRPVQYNRLSNPSRCHFGIIGSIYNINGNEPFSMIDMVKPFLYMYDIVMDTLRKLLARDAGKIIRMDFAKVPKGWDADKWIYYMKVNGIAVEDSAKEISYGPATGKVAASLNNNTSGVIDASTGNEIQFRIQLLEWIDTQVGSILGISKQREGQISNRETVGGVERATLQSSHITKWLFFIHDDVKKRVLECLLETAKIALKGRKEKFKYILSDGAQRVAEIDGDQFAECDYGLIVENSNGVQELNQKLDTLAQAALQNSMLNFSSMMKLYGTTSLQEKQRTVEAYERKQQEQIEQQQQQQMQMQQQQLQQEAQIAQQKQQLEYQMHQEELENKILVARINGEAEAQRFALMNDDTSAINEINNRKVDESIRQFDQKMEQEKAKLDLEKQKHQDDVRLKEEQIRKA